jgi:hypothetical protein
VVRIEFVGRVEACTAACVFRIVDGGIHGTASAYASAPIPSMRIHRRSQPFPAAMVSA